MDKHETEHTETKTTKRRLSRKTAILLILAGLLILGTAGFAAYSYWQRQNTNAGGENGLGREKLSGTLDINTVSAQLGPEEFVAGPSNAQDTPYFTERDLRDRWYAFTGNGSSYVVPLNEKTLLPTDPLPKNKDKIPKHRVILKPDTAVGRDVDNPKHPDACGAWILGSLYRDKKNPNHLYGWYHGEQNCLRGDREGGERTHMSLAFAESFDSGKNWRKPGYPNNRIITADRAFRGDSARDDTGNGRSIKIGDYYYIFYQSDSKQEPTAGRRIHVARAKVFDMGKPGTWKKWYCSDPKKRTTCGFSQPGIGGKSTKLTNSDELKKADGTSDTTWRNKYVLRDQYVSYNRYLNRYISFTNEHGSFRLLASEGDDVLNWKSKDERVQVMPTDENDYTIDNWNNGGKPDKCRKKVGGQLVDTNYECKQWYGYNSIIGLKGDSDGSGQTFYIYYVKHFPGQGFADGYTLRRKVKLVASTSTTKTAKTELAMYQNKKGKQRITSELPEPWLGYQRKARIGYVLSNPTPGYEPLFECKKPDGTYYTMRLAGARDYALPVPGDPPTKCNSTDKLIRRVGWVAPKRSSEASIAIYGNTSGISARGSSKNVIGYALPGI